MISDENYTALVETLRARRQGFVEGIIASIEVLENRADALKASAKEARAGGSPGHGLHFREAAAATLQVRSALNTLKERVQSDLSRM